MKLHRFYVEGMHNKWGPIELEQKVWIHDEHLLNQLLRVLRYRVGDKLVLFNNETERLYEIHAIEQPHSVGLVLVTEMERKLPTAHVYLLWSLLKKDKNDWVLQKATELGVRNFVPILADRSEKTGFDVDRAHKIIVEAAEQCGRSDIPEVREPITIDEALTEYSDKIQLIICEQGESASLQPQNSTPVGVLVGPEGGWSDREKELFGASNLTHLAISGFTLRAETAAVVAVSKVL
jgi:16S rRNA (uracil1498-N3)-methyltransferase